MHICILEWRGGGANAAPELAEVGSVIKREGFAVGAAAADAARGPGGGAIVLYNGLGHLAPKHEKTRKVRKSVVFLQFSQIP